MEEFRIIRESYPTMEQVAEGMRLIAESFPSIDDVAYNLKIQLDKLREERI